MTKKVEKVPCSHLIQFIPVNFGTKAHWKTLSTFLSEECLIMVKALMVFEL